MIKVLFAFVLLFAVFYAGITLARKMTGKEALALTKIAGYSILSSLLTLAVLISIVVIF
jgi:uncharacterized protein HemY